MNKVIIAAFARTPIGCFRGQFKSYKASQLAAIAMGGVMAKIPEVEPSRIQECVMAQVHRQVSDEELSHAAKLSGLHPNVRCMEFIMARQTCSSGMMSVVQGVKSILFEGKDLVLAGGFESMSAADEVPDALKGGFRTLMDPLLNSTALKCNHKNNLDTYGVTPEDQENYVSESRQRSILARDAGIFEHRELVPVDDVVLDEEIKCEGGQNGLTHGNLGDATMNDGAAALLLLSERKAEALGVRGIASIRSVGISRGLPLEFTVAPADSIGRVLNKFNCTIGDCDAFEINDAFPLIALANQRVLDIPDTILNAHGGAASLGHPVGCTGSRIVGSLVSVLQERDGAMGVASIGSGNGSAVAVVVERV